MLESSHSRQADTLWRAGLILTVGSTLGAALAIGGAHSYVLLAIAPLCLAGYAFLFLSFEDVEGPLTAWPAPTWVLVSLAAFSALQAVPLPVSVVRAVSPVAGDIWGRALSPFQESVEWGALSLDPGASLRESVKWLLYGLNFHAATLVAQRHGRRFPALVVFGSAVVVAVATLGHALTGAGKVFGVYEPVLRGSTWHVGPFLNPNTLAGYLNLGAFLALGLAFSRRVAEHRWLVAGGAAALVGLSVLSGSRGGVAVIPLGLLLFAALRLSGRAGERAKRKHRSVRYAPMLVALVVGVGFVVLGSNELTWKMLSDQNVDKLKVAVWALPMIGDFWLLGAGRGAFSSVFPAYSPELGNKVFTYAENFAVQWASEWGLPVAVVAAIALLVAFRPRNVSIRGDSLGAGAAAGITVVFLQNLVDFGLERIATPLAMTWAMAVLWRRGKGVNSTRHEQKLFSAAAVATGLLLTSLVFAYGRHDVRSVQFELHAAAAELDASNHEAVEGIRRRLRDAMLNAPAEPYFARLGAEISLRANRPDALRWVSRALDRGMNEASAHMLAARALHRYGATRQALLELRLAAKLDDGAATQSGRLAAAWGKSLEDLLRAAPEGSSGAKVLVTAASSLRGESARRLREQALRAAVDRDPDYLRARDALVKHLVVDIREGRCVAESGCAERAIAHANALIARAPTEVQGVELKAKMLKHLGRDGEAEAFLEKACAALSNEQRGRCLRLRLKLARSSASSSASRLAVAKQLQEEPCESDKDCASLNLELAEGLERSGDLLGALGLLERAARFEPSFDMHMKIADVAARLGRFRKADRALTQAQHFAKPDQQGLIQDRRTALRLELIRQSRR